MTPLHWQIPILFLMGLLGVFIGQELNYVTWMLLWCILLMMATVYLVGNVYWKFPNVLHLLFQGLLMLLVGHQVSQSWKMQSNETVQQEWVDSLEKYKLRHGKYPRFLHLISKDSSMVAIYRLHTLGDEMEICFESDGWAQRQYHSSCKCWSTRD